MEFKRNEILVQQFGYNMTLYNFYKVVRVSGKAVDLIELPKEVVKPVGFMQYVVEPKNKAGYMQKEVIKKRINKYGELSVNNDTLYKYDKTREYTEDHAD
jgi:hypothetical protein